MCLFWGFRWPGRDVHIKSLLLFCCCSFSLQISANTNKKKHIFTIKLHKPNWCINAALHTDVLMYNRFVIQFNCDFYFDLLNSLCILCPSYCVLIKMPLNWNLNGLEKNVYSSLIDWVNSELFCIRMYRKMLVYCTRKHTIQIQNIYSHERIIGPRREIKSSVHWLFVVASSLNRSNQLVEFNVRWIGIDCRKGFIYLLGTNCRISIKFIPY